MSPKRIDLVGQKFGRLVVGSFSHKGNDRHSYWLTKCDCGNIITVHGSALKTGNTKSCGCLKKEIVSTCNLRHGMSETQTYRSWQSMKKRCLSVNCKDYKHYGGRGISICDRWLNSFENFLEDMGEKPEGLTLERKNNNGNYELSNFKWATRKEQANNRGRDKKKKGLQRGKDD